MPVDRFSSLTKLLRVTALVYLFVAKLKHKVKTKLDCFNMAKNYWVQVEQRKYLSNEIIFLSKPENKVPVLIKNLNLFLDEDKIIRSKGRLDNCTQDTRCVILFYSQNRVSSQS